MGGPRSAARGSCTFLQSRAQLTLTFLGCRQAKPSCKHVQHIDPKNRMRIWSNRTRCLDEASHWLLEHLITARSLSSNYCGIDVARTRIYRKENAVFLPVFQVGSASHDRSTKSSINICLAIQGQNMGR